MTFMKPYKLFFRAILPLLTATTLVSCGNDWLDLTPDDSVDAGTAISSSGNLAAVRTSMYSYFKGNSSFVDYYAQLMFVYGDVRGEDIQYNHAGGSNRGNFHYYMTYSSAVDFYCSNKVSTAVWQSPYVITELANRILEANTFSDQESAAATIAQYKAEAKVMRAFTLFDLTRIYGKPYTQDGGASLGVPIADTSLSAYDLPARSTVAKCYEHVLSDLTEAISSGSLSTDSSPYYINVWAAKALLVRVYLTMGDWQNALSVAEDIIENGPYTLWTTAQYASAWKDTDANHKNEMLFEMSINNTSDYTGSIGIAYLFYGYNDLIMTKAFLDMLESDPEDVRQDICQAASNAKEVAAYGTRKVFLRKYQGATSNDVRYDDVPILRLSEVYLSAAEAAFNANDKKKAAQYLNDIIENRTTDNSKLVTESTVTLDRIYLERRKELVGEGQRYFDALRRGETITRYTSADDQGWHGVLNADAQVITPQSKKLLPLIPQDEINANPNIEQNPLY